MNRDVVLWLGIATYVLDFWYFQRAYRDRNIFGLAFWGVLLLVITIVMTAYRLRMVL